VWWIAYRNINGKTVPESTGTKDYRKAKAMLEAKIARIAVGEFVAPKAQNISVNDIVEFSLNVAQGKGNRNVGKDRATWEKQLRPEFGYMPALALVDGVKLMEYKTRLLDQGRDSDTVNRHFSILRCAFNRSKARLSKQQPDWKNLFSKETDNPEHVKMIDDDVYLKLAAEAAKVGVWCRTLLELGCEIGWRKAVWLNLKVKDVDMLNCKLTLPGLLSKNKEPYTAFFTQGSNLYTLLSACVTGKRQDDYVLTRDDGKPVRDFSRVWLTITRKAGIEPRQGRGGRLIAGVKFHNTRNTAATRMIQAGLSEVEAMARGGWKTRNIFEHYHISNDEAKQEAAKKMAARKLNYVLNYGAQDMVQSSATAEGVEIEPKSLPS
jgi:integrase